jgi:hypothetical protein
MLTANVGFLAIPGVVLSNLNGNLTSASQAVIFTSHSQIASCLSMELSIGSIIIGLLLVCFDRSKHKEDPAGAATGHQEDPAGTVSGQLHLMCGAKVTLGQSRYLYQSYHRIFSLEPMAIYFGLPLGLLMWSYVISCLPRRCTRFTFLKSTRHE